MPNIQLSQYIAAVLEDMRKNYPHIKIVATYLNPNAHKGLVYRGAGFLPWGIEEHPFNLFLEGTGYISPREAIKLFKEADRDHRPVFTVGKVRPLPQLLLYYQLHGDVRNRVRDSLPQVCQIKYPRKIISAAEWGKATALLATYHIPSPKPRPAQKPALPRVVDPTKSRLALGTVGEEAASPMTP